MACVLSVLEKYIHVKTVGSFAVLLQVGHGEIVANTLCQHIVKEQNT
jgi:hypothetical protein